MKTYLAARFPRREEMENLVPFFADLGFDITARWVFGGEEGLTRAEIADLDLEDVENAECIILFTEKYGTPQPGGGRFVEFGYALAQGLRAIVIGDYENVFTHHKMVEVYPDLETFKRCVMKQAA